MSKQGESEILSLTYMRGFAALSIVIFHMRGYLNNIYLKTDLGDFLFDKLNFGVDLFFIISGFIIVYATRKIEHSNTLSFLIRRFFRVYPLFLVCITVGILSIYSDSSTEQIVRALFLIHQNYSLPSPTFGFNLMGPAWTLTYELYFYFIFSVSLLINHKYRTEITCILLLCQIITPQLLLNGGLHLSAYTGLDTQSHNYLAGFLQFSSNTMFYDFILGMLLAKIYLNGNKLNTGSGKLVMIAFSAIFVTLVAETESTQVGPQNYGYMCLFLVMGFLLYEKKNKLKKVSILVFLGNISYALYISHYIVIDGMHKYNLLFWQYTAGVTRILAMVSLCIGISWLLHIIIEKPFIRMGKIVINKLHSKEKIVSF
ncbi:acyltransferase family protein [Rahnella victoriana]|uniref:Acyltransferase n=1 Tax=Rahnella victoriana TaxID=1510570 RepID=A0ABS0DQS8_9GAMM|nr:acyltransferase [Rahnella victoriana]MBF7956254.1 acyltransferase [Rahnella victoriana]